MCMKKLISAVFILVGLSSALFGSATIFKEDGGDTVRFSVNVEADVYIDGVNAGKVQGGNFMYQFARDKDGSKNVVFKKAGYNDVSVIVQRQMDYLVLANFFGSYFSTSSTTTDVANGNHKKHTPNQFMINMQKAE